jgi:flagellar motor switch protein FliM
VKPERAFIAERAVAQHCDALLRNRAAAPDAAPSLARALPHLEAALATGIAAMTGGDAPRVTCEEPRQASHAEFVAQTAPLAGVCVLGAGHHGVPLLAVIDAAAVFGFVDRAFGGQGQCPEPMPEAFPLSAELMLGRLAGVIGAAVVHAFCAQAAPSLRPIARGGRITLVSPIAEAETLNVLRLTVIEDAHDPWRISLAFPPAALAALFHDAGEGGLPMPAPRVANLADPLAEPFATMPLTLAATLVDMRIAFSAIARLRVGDVLPVAVARSVPVSVGGQTIAHGAIGEIDDRVAVRLTQIF